MSLRHEANLLGAFAQVVDDRTTEAVVAAAGQAEMAATALSALHHFLERPTLDLLRQVLGLTQSGTVRLVDRLVEAGLVRREPGPDGRSRAVTLTDDGRRAAERVSAARAEVLADALAVLSPDERLALSGMLGRVMATFVRGPGATRWICRMCDTAACGRDQGECPVANASRT